VAKYLAIIEEKRQHRPHTRDWQLIYAVWTQNEERI